VTGEARMLGLFTSKAYAEPASQTPLLNRKLRQILRHEDLIEGSHDYKAAVALFDSFPKDELFSARTDDLRRAVSALLSIEGDRVRLLGRRSSDNRSVSLIAALPAERYTPELLDAFTDLLRSRFESDAVETHTVLDEDGQRVRIHITVHAPAGVPDISLRELEETREYSRTVTSLERPVGEEGDTQLGDLLPSDAPEPVEEVEIGLRQEAVHRALENLSEQEQKVIRLRYGINGDDPTPLREAGKRLGLSPERVRRIEHKALERLSCTREVAALSEAA
jgi:RNA polymerase sigma factor (sigma-70 family)